jgi:hypothetical protein
MPCLCSWNLNLYVWKQVKLAFTQTDKYGPFRGDFYMLLDEYSLLVLRTQARTIMNHFSVHSARCRCVYEDR